MALIFIDGFDHYDDADGADKYSSVAATFDVTTDSTLVRTGIGSMELEGSSGNAVVAVPAQETYIVGFGLKLSHPASGASGVGAADQLVYFYEDGVSGVHVSLNVTGDNRFQVARSIFPTQAILGTTAEQFDLDDGWHYIEFKVKIHNTLGSFELKFDEENILSATNVDTRRTGGVQAPNGVIKNINFRRIEASVVSTWFDDIYICDTTGTKNNDFLGDCQVTTIFPKTDGALEDWALQAGSNSFAMVDENPPDDEITYVQSNTVGHKDSFDMDDVSGMTTILGIQLTEYAKFLTGSADIKHLARVGGTNYLGSSKILAATYDFHMHIYENDPDISSAWTVSGLNSSEFGMEVV